ncbi:hypothetical protein FHG87_004937 [Trinorchestia longiramus]|nr:hypothetical protein FHG87_004937 [Trinorchestia longiramus]
MATAGSTAAPPGSIIPTGYMGMSAEPTPADPMTCLQPEGNVTPVRDSAGGFFWPGAMKDDQQIANHAYYPHHPHPPPLFFPDAGFGNSQASPSGELMETLSATPFASYSGSQTVKKEDFKEDNIFSMRSQYQQRCREAFIRDDDPLRQKYDDYKYESSMEESAVSRKFLSNEEFHTATPYSEVKPYEYRDVHGNMNNIYSLNNFSSFFPQNNYHSLNNTHPSAMPYSPANGCDISEAHRNSSLSTSMATTPSCGFLPPSCMSPMSNSSNSPNSGILTQSSLSDASGCTEIPDASTLRTPLGGSLKNGEYLTSRVLAGGNSDDGQQDLTSRIDSTYDRTDDLMESPLLMHSDHALTSPHVKSLSSLCPPFPEARGSFGALSTGDSDVKSKVNCASMSSARGNIGPLSGWEQIPREHQSTVWVGADPAEISVHCLGGSRSRGNIGPLSGWEQIPREHRSTVWIPQEHRSTVWVGADPAGASVHCLSGSRSRGIISPLSEWEQIPRDHRSTVWAGPEPGQQRHLPMETSTVYSTLWPQ